MKHYSCTNNYCTLFLLQLIRGFYLNSKCISYVLAAVVLGVVGGIVLLGILLLIAWKIVTTIHDGREYAKFEKESKNAQFDRVSTLCCVGNTVADSMEDSDNNT